MNFIRNLQEQFACFMLVVMLSLFGVAGAAYADERDELIRAVRLDLLSEVQEKLQLGMDVNTAEPYRGETLLMLAIRENSTKVAQALLQQPGIQINHRARNGDSAVMLASYLGQLEMVKQLLQRHAEINHPGWTALHYAATSGQLEIIKLLLEHHAYIDAESPNKTTPLMMASRAGKLEVLQLLIDEGADVNVKNALGLSAIDFAELAEQRENAAFLREASAKKLMR